MATKRLTKVTLTLFDSVTVVFDDSAIAGVGTSAAAALEKEQMVIGMIGTKKTYVPFHAILKAEVEYTTSEVEAPTDATCVIETAEPENP